MGLFAAIPAVIGYNRFSARVEVLMKRYEAFADEVTSVLQRAAQARVGRA
jgi:biopolymer transport protein TolQ